MTPREKRVQQGIAGYRYEQEVILRILRRYGPICDANFDAIFGDYKITIDPVTYDTIRTRRPAKLRFLWGHGSAFILGGAFAGDWAKWLELIQCMAILGMVKTLNKNDSHVWYQLAEDAE